MSYEKLSSREVKKTRDRRFCLVCGAPLKGYPSYIETGVFDRQFQTVRLCMTCKDKTVSAYLKLTKANEYYMDDITEWLYNEIRYAPVVDNLFRKEVEQQTNAPYTIKISFVKVGTILLEAVNTGAVVKEDRGKIILTKEIDINDILNDIKEYANNGNV